MGPNDWEPTEWWDDSEPPDKGFRIHPEDTCLAWSDVGKGTRVRWKTQTFVKRGTVQSRDKRSMTVLFDAHFQPTVIPDAKWYFVEGKVGNLNEHLVTISTPSPAYPQRQQKGFPLTHKDTYISPNEAAALLGTDPKNIRRMIRNGKLLAHREGGRWVLKRSDVESG